MAQIDNLADAALSGDALKLRSLTQDFLRQIDLIAQCPPPESRDRTLRAIAAGLVEMFAERSHQSAPSWAHGIEAAPHPVFLVKAAQTMMRLRKLCETESPLPLRRRNLLAPPNFLTFA